MKINPFFLWGVALGSIYLPHSTWAAIPEKTQNAASAPTNLPTHPNDIQRLKADKISIADTKKTQAQVRDGLIIGGDRAIHPVIVKDIRFSNQKELERVVIDLEGTQNGEPAAIPRPPYFQVEVNPNQKRIGVSVWGNPELRFDSKKITTAFKKSNLLESVDLLPKLEDEVWTFSLPLKSAVNVEVFELTQPVRIIIDLSKKRG